MDVATICVLGVAIILAGVDIYFTKIHTSKQAKEDKKEAEKILEKAQAERQAAEIERVMEEKEELGEKIQRLSKSKLEELEALWNLRNEIAAYHLKSIYESERQDGSPRWDRVIVEIGFRFKDNQYKKQSEEDDYYSTMSYSVKIDNFEKAKMIAKVIIDYGEEVEAEYYKKSGLRV